MILTLATAGASDPYEILLSPCAPLDWVPPSVTPIYLEPLVAGRIYLMPVNPSGGYPIPADPVPPPPPPVGAVYRVIGSAVVRRKA